MHNTPSQKVSDKSLNWVKNVCSWDWIGGVTLDSLSELIDESELQHLVIYRCYTEINDHMCRSAAMQKAYHSLNWANKNYNLLRNNCEDFVHACCSYLGTPVSFQVEVPIV